MAYLLPYEISLIMLILIKAQTKLMKHSKTRWLSHKAGNYVVFLTVFLLCH
jgi:hypothetical protein